MARIFFQNSLKDNAKFVEEDANLVTLWEWVDYCRILTDKERYRLPALASLKYPGARAALKMDLVGTASPTPLKSEVIHNNSFDLHSSKTYR